MTEEKKEDPQEPRTCSNFSCMTWKQGSKTPVKMPLSAQSRYGVKSWVCPKCKACYKE